MVTIWQYVPTKEHRRGGLRRVDPQLAKALIAHDMAQPAGGAVNYKRIARVHNYDALESDPPPKRKPGRPKKVVEDAEE